MSNDKTLSDTDRLAAMIQRNTFELDAATPELIDLDLWSVEDLVSLALIVEDALDEQIATQVELLREESYYDPIL